MLSRSLFCTTFLLIMNTLHFGVSLSVDDFYLYGSGVDQSLSRGDDATASLDVTPFPFFGFQINTVFVSHLG